ncbi:MAG: aminotransferase class IV [Bacteroidota bacterium]
MTTGKILGERYTINGESADVSDFQPDMSVDVYYEVVRLIGGKILFLDDHLQRLKRSLAQSGLEIPGEPAILKSLQTLLRYNKLTLGNIRICIQKSRDDAPNLLCYFVPYHYPGESMYSSGVQVASYRHERPNPGIKKWDNSFRVSVANHIRTHGVYEAILVNERDEITEGSRSNLFFIDSKDRLVTPPAENVLQGITRKYVLQICRQERIEVTERPVSQNELSSLVSCFISGTSPKVLPVLQLDEVQFRVDHPVLKRIMERFENLLLENLKTIT